MKNLNDESFEQIAELMEKNSCDLRFIDIMIRELQELSEIDLDEYFYLLNVKPFTNYNLDLDSELHKEDVKAFLDIFQSGGDLDIKLNSLVARVKKTQRGLKLVSKNTKEILNMFRV